MYTALQLALRSGHDEAVEELTKMARLLLAPVPTYSAEQAAKAIQAAYRGHRARQEVSSASVRPPAQRAMA